MSTCEHVERLRSAVQATQVQPPFSWFWFWEHETTLPLRLRRSLPPETARTCLIHGLQQRLYSHFYCKGAAVPVQSFEAQPSPVSSKSAFVNALSAANHGKGFVQHGWEVIDQKGDLIAIQQNGLRLYVNDGETSFLRVEPIKGDKVSTSMPKELPFMSPGFYQAMGDEVLPTGGNTPVVRLYWNLHAEGATVLMRALTSTFNRDRIPYRLKVVDDPNLFIRADSAVLYTAKEDYSRIRPLLELIQPKVAPYLKNETPAFTKRLRLGLGIAEQPNRGVSFGMHRCQILAEGLVRVAELRETAVSGRVAAVQDYFDEQGVSLDQPFLNPGSEDIFHLAPRSRLPGTARGRRIPKQPAIRRETLLETAFDIGSLLCEAAIWHDERCNWMGVGFPQNSLPRQYDSGLAYQTLGPDFYAGTSGIALFLAELHAATGEIAVRRTALGAIRQAISASCSPSLCKGLGLYEGVLGVAVAAAYVGRRLGEEDLVRRAVHLVEDALRRNPVVSSADLVSGSGGAIVALLILGHILGGFDRSDFAVQLGSQLVRAAQRKGECCSWKSPDFPKQRGLLGLSHGTAGVAHGLIELYRATQNTEYRDLAQDAFKYERLWFNEELGNWPDFRGVPARATRIDCPVDFPAFWCHGAAGIALSRLHAFRVLDDERCRSEALTALTTTLRWTLRTLDSGVFNFSLCHGLAGNADILTIGSEILGDAFPDGREVAMKVAAEGIRKHGARRHQWPFGSLGSRAPGLMLGLSGVGYFYLRLYDRKAPSVLLLERDALEI